MNAKEQRAAYRARIDDGMWPDANVEERLRLLARVEELERDNVALAEEVNRLNTAMMRSADETPAEPPSMDIYSPAGTRIVFSRPTAGYPDDVRRAAQLLTVGATYTVRNTDVHSSITYVRIVEHPGAWFNSVQFTRAPEKTTASQEVAVGST